MYVVPYMNALRAFWAIWAALPLPIGALCNVALFAWGGVALLDILTKRT